VRRRKGADSEALAERATNAATSVLTLAGVDQNRGAVRTTLLAALFSGSWAGAGAWTWPG
jgi:hypothetical protein